MLILNCDITHFELESKGSGDSKINIAITCQWSQGDNMG